MEATVDVNVKLDPETKDKMERACEAMGLSMNAAFAIFAKRVGLEMRIPFEVSADPFYSESNTRYLKKVIDGIEDGTRKLVEHDLIEVDDHEIEMGRGRLARLSRLAD